MDNKSLDVVVYAKDPGKAQEIVSLLKAHGYSVVAIASDEERDLAQVMAMDPDRFGVEMVVTTIGAKAAFTKCRLPVRLDTDFRVQAVREAAKSSSHR